MLFAGKPVTLLSVERVTWFCHGYYMEQLSRAKFDLNLRIFVLRAKLKLLRDLYMDESYGRNIVKFKYISMVMLAKYNKSTFLFKFLNCTPVWLEN